MRLYSKSLHIGTLLILSTREIYSVNGSIRLPLDEITRWVGLALKTCADVAAPLPATITQPALEFLVVLMDSEITALRDAETRASFRSASLSGPIDVDSPHSPEFQDDPETLEQSLVWSQLADSELPLPVLLHVQVWTCYAAIAAPSIRCYARDRYTSDDIGITKYVQILK